MIQEANCFRLSDFGFGFFLFFQLPLPLPFLFFPLSETMQFVCAYNKFQVISLDKTGYFLGTNGVVLVIQQNKHYNLKKGLDKDGCSLS